MVTAGRVYHQIQLQPLEDAGCQFTAFNLLWAAAGIPQLLAKHTRKTEHIQRHNGTFPSVRAFLSIAHLRPPPSAQAGAVKNHKLRR